MQKTSKILVTGASGLIGSALVRLLKAEGYENVLTPTHDELDLTWKSKVVDYFFDYRPEYIFHLAAYVGGIQSNIQEPATFSRVNTDMISIILWASHITDVKKLLFPGSACAYPRQALQPIKEQDFLNGAPESTNLAYAVAKINGIVMAQSYAKQYGMNVVLPMVANTYGENDKSSHVIPHMVQKFKSADDEVMLWGTGTSLREFIHADDVVDAFLFLMQNYDSHEIINVGTMEEISICKLANKIHGLTGCKHNIVWDTTKPNGIQRKILDSSKLYAMGWKPKVSLNEGLRRVIANKQNTI